MLWSLLLLLLFRSIANKKRRSLKCAFTSACIINGSSSAEDVPRRRVNRNRRVAVAKRAAARFEDLDRALKTKIASQKRIRDARNGRQRGGTANQSPRRWKHGRHGEAGACLFNDGNFWRWMLTENNTRTGDQSRASPSSPAAPRRPW